MREYNGEFNCDIGTTGGLEDDSCGMSSKEGGLLFHG